MIVLILRKSWLSQLKFDRKLNGYEYRKIFVVFPIRLTSDRLAYLETIYITKKKNRIRILDKYGFGLIGIYGE